MFAMSDFLDTAIFCFAAFLFILGIFIKVFMPLFRTDDWIKIQKHEEEMKQQRDERMKKMATGGIKAVGILARLIGRK